jgi:flagella basal body P-ring formation protein FlgA
MLALAPLTGLQAQSASADGFTDPGEIDRAVAGFTGAQIGEVGGALSPADPRLRLAACGQPLNAAWQGRAGSAVRVECPDANGWRIYVAIRPAPVAAQAAIAVKRGDPMTVIVRGRGFTVQQAGEAMENGQIGDWIAIRTAKRGEPLRARIERPGLAEIPAD